jgi:hypothetical protein
MKSLAFKSRRRKKVKICGGPGSVSAGAESFNCLHLISIASTFRWRNVHKGGMALAQFTKKISFRRQPNASRINLAKAFKDSLDYVWLKPIVRTGTST